MALLKTKPFSATILELPHAEPGLETWNHVLEPEFHQDRYVDACTNAASSKGSFQLGDGTKLKRPPSRGLQPLYADTEDEPDSLEYLGMVLPNGAEIGDCEGNRNICALKSVSVRWGYVDFSVARSVTRRFAEGKAAKALVQRHDLLINSTGDGTIGRVAVFDEEFPAVVDGHVTIVRFKDTSLAWYAAAYLLSSQGQDQIYRYINGSSGQVEIYPQDISRLWIPVSTKQKEIVQKFQAASRKHRQFFKEMQSALNLLES